MAEEAAAGAAASRDRLRNQPRPCSPQCPAPRRSGVPKAACAPSSMRYCPMVDGGRFPAKRIAGEPVDGRSALLHRRHDKLRVVLSWQARGRRDESYEVDDDARCPTMSGRAEFTPPVSGPLSLHGDRRGWIISNRGGANSSGARIRRHSRGAAGRAPALVARLRPGAARAMTARLCATGLEQLRATAATRPRRPTSSAHEGAGTRSGARRRGRALCRSHACRASQSLELIADRKRAAVQQLVRTVSALGGCRARAPRHLSRRRGAAAATWPHGLRRAVLPPIHPIGRVNRKGANNASRRRDPDDVGSPWAIGSAEGGHKDILPELGTLEISVVWCEKRARARHRNRAGHRVSVRARPSVRESAPEWFKHRPDGSVQYAENPPKKYQDIYPFDFESDDWRGLWTELKSVVDFGSSRACGYSASTTRIPSRSPSGNG